MTTNEQLAEQTITAAQSRQHEAESEQARKCLDDATTDFRRDDFDSAIRWALESLRISVGHRNETYITLHSAACSAGIWSL